MGYFIASQPRKNLRSKYKMSTSLRTNAKGDIAQKADQSLVSTAAFNNEFYTYATSLNSSFATVGTFTLVSGATAAKCPAGRVLHLTGRKLFPDVNPMNTFVGGSPLQAKKFLVAVYDPISFLTGFVDPTSSTFAKFDQNMPNFFDLGTAGSGVVPSLGGEGVDVNVGRNLTVENNLTIAAGGKLNVGTTIAGQVVLVAGTLAITVAGVTTSSLAFVTLVTPNTGTLTVKFKAVCTANTVTITALIAAGTINIADISTVNYLVVN